MAVPGDTESLRDFVGNYPMRTEQVVMFGLIMAGFGKPDIIKMNDML